MGNGRGCLDNLTHLKEPNCSSLSNNADNTFAQIINRMGESGLPFPKPLEGLILPLPRGLLLNNNLTLTVVINCEISVMNFSPNPKNFKYCQKEIPFNFIIGVLYV